ncbi:MAG: hypothetical protein K8S16_08500 [Bacteroidales bacterium]|nr:hypothetical protein [Bacteroidales bacterium]
MNRMISINRINKPTLFGNQLIEFLFEKINEIEITLYGKLEQEDKKVLKKFYKTSIIRELIFKIYNFKLDFKIYKDIQGRLEKYFMQDWGIFIHETNKGLFSFKMNNFFIDCTDKYDKKSKMQFFDSLIKSGIIDTYEFIEDDYVDPYFKNKKNHSE